LPRRPGRHHDPRVVDRQRRERTARPVLRAEGRRDPGPLQPARRQSRPRDHLEEGAGMTTHFGQHVPDILDCLAQLSNDEVPTPPKLARAMLDLLPEEVWMRPDFVWLDPFSKSGVFLREIASRLFDSLADWEPDFVKRREHIMRNMLFGASITEMTGIISRRSLYCAADASSTHSVVMFNDP